MSLLHRYNGWSMNFNMHRWTWMNENKNDGRTPKISITTGTTKLSSDATGLHSGWEAKLYCLRDTASSGAWRLLKFLEHMKKRGEPWPRDRSSFSSWCSTYSSGSYSTGSSALSTSSKYLKVFFILLFIHRDRKMAQSHAESLITVHLRR